MIIEDLNSLAVELSLTYDAAAASAYGVYKGFGICVRAVEQKNCYIVTAWARKGALTSVTADKWLSDYVAKPENSFVKSYAAHDFHTAAVLLADADSQKNYTGLHGFIFDLVTYFSMNYYSNTCASCGSAIGLTFEKNANGAYTQLCRMCAENNHEEQPAVQNVGTAPVQTMQNVGVSPVQTMQNVGAAPVQTMQNVGAVPVQTMQNVAAAPMQPIQNMNTAPMQAPAYPGSTVMDAIDPNTAPESTGFSTAESLAAIPPPIESNIPIPQNYNPAPEPIPNDFRADPSYQNAPYVYSQVRPTNIYDGKASNPLLGFLGAILFTLAACVLWVLIGRMGYISYIGGLAMGFCCVTGYKVFGKKFDVFGLISGIIVILIAVLVCNMVIETWSLYDDIEAIALVEYYGYNGFFDVFFHFFDLVGTVDNTLASAYEMTGNPELNISIMSVFIRDLLISYIFAGVGFCVTAIPAFKNRR